MQVLKFVDIEYDPHYRVGRQGMEHEAIFHTLEEAREFARESPDPFVIYECKVIHCRLKRLENDQAR